MTWYDLYNIAFSLNDKARKYVNLLENAHHLASFMLSYVQNEH